MTKIKKQNTIDSLEVSPWPPSHYCSIENYIPERRKKLIDDAGKVKFTGFLGYVFLSHMGANSYLKNL